MTLSLATRLVPLIILALLLPGGPVARAQTAPNPADLMPPLEIMARALADGGLPRLKIDNSDRSIPEAIGIQAAKRFTVDAGDDGRMGLIVRTAVLGSPATAADYVDILDLGFFRRNNQIDEGYDIPRRGALDQLRWLRMVYDSSTSDEGFASSYVFILRRDQIVVALELAGAATPQEQAGKIRDQEARGLNPTRHNALVAFMDSFAMRIGQLTTPEHGEKPSARTFEPFAQGWSERGLNLHFETGGKGAMAWRVYKWCQDDPTPPCDKMIGNRIEGGGTAILSIAEVATPFARGEVTASTDPNVAPNGEILIGLLPFDRLRVQLGEQRHLLCGPAFTRSAPRDYVESQPCGS